ncbi:hypothetical protein M5W68_10480 [Paenibacillus larvae]|uniref:hypothetical protein n=1 Tax=Paenibacillus larvae TaxID=1464 RepID=UPI00227E1E6F|nr:hypothetical protein [Paenibacillus larvae]MCY9511956.1 hypothetical protein [Paenibacillus larvae]MCY9525538.1 hypothetical protein [Paenibacillus larvae]
MSSLVYLVIGIFDALAMLVLILKLYRIPILRYSFKIFVFASFISIFSYFMRVVFGVAQFDLPLQYVLFVLFLRYSIQIKIHYSAFIAGIGITAYTSLQLVIYYIYTHIGIIDISVLYQNSGMAVLMIQLTSILTAYLISYILKLFNLGFSIVIMPPHEFSIREDYLSEENRQLLISVIVSIFTISLTVFLLYRAKALTLIIVAVASFCISYYFSHRRERLDDRKYIQEYIKKDKAE